VPGLCEIYIPPPLTEAVFQAMVLFEMVGDPQEYIPPPLYEAVFPEIVLFVMVGEEEEVQ